MSVCRPERQAIAGLLCLVMLIVGLLLACGLFVSRARAGRNAVLFSVALNSEGGEEGSYGSLKSDLLTYLSWDNKLRYCKQHTITCVFWMSNEQHMLSPRMNKVQQILRVMKQRKAPNVAYLDADIVITQPLHNWFDFKSEESELTAFYDSYALLAMTEDYNHTTAMRPSLDSENRYQTGVIFLKAVKKTRRIVKEWLNLAEVGLQAINTSSSSSASNTVSDNSNLNSDQWLFNQLLLQQPTLKSLVHILTPRHVYNAFPAYHIHNQSGLQPNNNSSKVAQFWEDLKLPLGDEVHGVSQMVHFAGVFGGASIETGKTDPVVQLLAVYGYIERHLHSVRMLSEAPLLARNTANIASDGGHSESNCVRCNVVSHAQAILLLESLLVFTYECINSVFSMDTHITDTSEIKAINCLQAIKEQSKNLLGDLNQTKTDIFSLENKLNLYYCCV